jgi:hypothetical protein
MFIFFPRPKNERILDFPSPYFPPLLDDQLWFYGEGFIKHPQWDMGEWE